MLKSSLLAGFAALWLCPSAFADDALQAQIRWTKTGIPHIQAATERGLGYGIGYAYARDNACLLANEIVTARGERSRFFGSKGQNSAHLGNLPSDFFFTWLNQPQALKTLWANQPAPIQQRLDGYARGFNAYLKVANKTTTHCLGEAWLKPISTDDLLRLTRRLLVEGGAGQFAEALVSATPPGAASASAATVTREHIAQLTDKFRLERGSNAIAIGGERSATGSGILLANPHFPWSGALRFYQMHLTIPGQLDVMGAALPGLPLVNIGFNQHLAWTHTVDTAAHFTLYRLQLDPNNSRRYMLDGKSLALKKTTLTVQVLDDGGRLNSVSHDLYESNFGPLLRLPGMLEWTASEAFALRDANLDNSRVLQQWYAINQAKDVGALQASVEKLQGIPWVNTVATDARGQTLYMDQSVVPYLRPQQLAECVIPQLAEQGLPGLQGHRSACEWSVDASTAQPGITPAKQLPVLRRNDFVQNSNDSAWLTNPASPLQGFSPLVSREGRPLSPRAQFALSRLQGNAPITPEFLRAMVTDNHVYLAERLLPDLLTLCGKYPADDGIKPACAALTNWNRSANSTASIGMLYFQAFFRAFSEIPNAWRVPFNPAQPLNTPDGLALDNPKVAEQLRLALVDASQTVGKSGVPANATWGDVQWLQRGDQRIAIPGGDGHLGIYNAMQSVHRADHLEVVSGSSYIQLVTFNAQGPQAHGLLAFSQSTEPGSKHYADQTQLFAQQQWPLLPFSQAEIAADGVVETIDLQD